MNGSADLTTNSRFAGALTSLGVDAYGELYITDLNDNVFEIRKGRD